MRSRAALLGLTILSLVCVFLLSCASLEPVTTNTEVAERPVGKEEEEEPQKPGFPDIPEMIESIAVESILPAAHPSSFVVDDILRRCPIPPDKEILQTVLSRNAGFRVLLLQTNVDLKARYNKKHHEIVQVHKGQGILILGRDRYVAKPGQIFVVPRKMVHRLQNTGDKPFVALVVEVPPSQGRDTVYVRKPPE